MKENLKAIIKEWFEYKTGATLNDETLNDTYDKLTKERTERYEVKKLNSVKSELITQELIPIISKHIKRQGCDCQIDYIGLRDKIEIELIKHL